MIKISAVKFNLGFGNASRKYKFKNWFLKRFEYLKAAALGGKTL